MFKILAVEYHLATWELRLFINWGIEIKNYYKIII